jgi:hypothetical protein
MPTSARARGVSAQHFTTGYAGWESDDLTQLITKNTDIWQASVGVFQTILPGPHRAPGRLRGGVTARPWPITSSRQFAFADVEDALVARRTSVLVRARRRSKGSGTTARDLAQIRYDAGDSSYIEVFDAQRQLFQAQLRRRGSSHRVGLIRAVVQSVGRRLADRGVDILQKLASTASHAISKRCSSPRCNRAARADLVGRHGVEHVAVVHGGERRWPSHRRAPVSPSDPTRVIHRLIGHDQ